MLNFFLGIGTCLAVFLLVYALRKLSLKGIAITVIFIAVVAAVALLFANAAGSDYNPYYAELGPIPVRYCVILPLLVILIFWKQIIYILVALGLGWLIWKIIGPFLWDCFQMFVHTCPVIAGAGFIFILAVLALAAMNVIDKAKAKA